MKQHKPKVIKIREDEIIKGIVDWSKLVGKQFSIDWSSKPQLVRKNNTLEEELLALSRKGYLILELKYKKQLTLEKELLGLSKKGGNLVECGYLIARCADREYKQFCTSLNPYSIHDKDSDGAFYRLEREIGGNWDNVITLEFIHTHPNGRPLSQADIKTADSIAKRLYPKGVKNIAITAVAESGYSFRYSPPKKDILLAGLLEEMTDRLTDEKRRKK